MAIEFESNPFWDHSLDIYGRKGVSAALITFQDRHSLDVNLLLLCLWAGNSGRGVLDDAEMEHALTVSANWNPNIVCAVREVRIRLREEIALVPKDLSDAFHKKLLRLEIGCEHVEHMAIVAGLGEKRRNGRKLEDKLRDCGLNLKSYFDRKQCNLDENDRGALFTILSATFGDISPDEIRSFCGEMFL